MWCIVTGDEKLFMTERVWGESCWAKVLEFLRRKVRAMVVSWQKFSVIANFDMYKHD